jgi:hypothetical protein
MVGRVWCIAASFAVAGIISGCSMGGFGSGHRAEWRKKAEAACMARGVARAPGVQTISLRGGGACGADHALKVSALANGSVALRPDATINCPMVVALDRWIANSVQRAAHAHFREPVVEIRQIASYSCRGRNGSSRGPLSEHAFANALDIGGFKLASGREIKVLRWWRGTPQERAFLRDAFTGACAQFYTVLGPGSDRFHADHFHLDLLLTNAKNGRHYCRPQPAQIAANPDGNETTASIGGQDGDNPPLMSFVGPAP